MDIDRPDISQENAKARVAVVGSGPAGIAAATVLIEKGYAVDIYDGGQERETWSAELKDQLSDVIASEEKPDKAMYHSLLNGKEKTSFFSSLVSVFNAIVRNQVKADTIEKRNMGSRFSFYKSHEGIPLQGINLPRSLAVGGLSNVWGAACYPLCKEDYKEWPIDEDQLTPWYKSTQELLELDVADDGLSAIYPNYGDASNDAKGRLSPVFTQLMGYWENNKAALSENSVVFGQARTAVQHSADREDRCQQCGLCLTGCPVDAIWHSGKKLSKLNSSGLISYFEGYFIHTFEERGDKIFLKKLYQQRVEEIETAYEAVFLAAGTLSSYRIAAQSLGFSGEAEIYSNDLMIMPFKPVKPDVAHSSQNFALGEAVLSMGSHVTGSERAHLQMYQFSLPLMGPLAALLIQLPVKMRTLLERLAAKYVYGFLYLHSDDSTVYRAEIKESPRAPLWSINISIKKAGNSSQVFNAILQWLSKMGDQLAIRPIKWLCRPTPDGFSCHLGGTLPMKESPGQMQTDLSGKLYGTKRCYVVDASIFPTMPAQNPTLTIMANAMRIAAGLVEDKTDNEV